MIATSVCLLGASAFGQNATPSKANTQTATCNFDDQHQIVLNYEPLKINKKDQENYLGGKIHYGKVWEPGKQAMTLLTNTPVNIDGKQLPIGGYTVYLVPQRQEWTLIVSKNTNALAKYDESQDVARAPMQIGQLPHAEPEFSVYFAHSGPKECTMRVDLADTRAWVPFDQK
jgi:hypothetical protein